MEDLESVSYTHLQKELFINRVEEALRKRTKVQGGQVYIGQYLNKALIHAEDEATQMGDEMCIRDSYKSVMRHFVGGDTLP